MACESGYTHDLHPSAGQNSKPIDTARRKMRKLREQPPSRFARQRHLPDEQATERKKTSVCLLWSTCNQQKPRTYSSQMATRT